MTVREEAHRLIDEVPEDRLASAVELLGQWAEVDRKERPGRRFRTTGVFDGEADLGSRSKEFVRGAWDGQEHREA